MTNDTKTFDKNLLNLDHVSQRYREKYELYQAKPCRVLPLPNYSLSHIKIETQGLLQKRALQMGKGLSVDVIESISRKSQAYLIVGFARIKANEYTKTM